jgi:hypothetical protein
MRKSWLWTICILLLAGPALLAAEEGNEEVKWYDKLDLNGSLRLRYEAFDWDDHYDDGRRDRFRYRFRIGMQAQVSDDVLVGFQLASGNPNNPISDNQTFDDGLNKNRISISEAFVRWTASERITVTGGKFAPQKIWHVSDMQWDDDTFAEGALENFAWKPGGTVKSVDLNLYQFILNESGSSSDSYLFGGQFVPVFDLGEKNDLAVGLGYEAVSNPDPVIELYFDEDLVIDSGYVTNLVDPETGELVSDFRVGSLFLEWKNKSSKRWPVKLSLFYYKNFGAADAVGSVLPIDADDPPLVEANAKDHDTAFFGRIQVGDYKKPGQVAVRLARYDSGPDAIFFAYAQSDSRRSSNVDGWRTDVRIGMPRKGYVNVTWYHTDWTIGEDTTMDRLQVDYIFKF